MHRVTHSYWSGGQQITAPGEHGGTVPCSRAPQPWQGGELPPLQLSAHQSFYWAVSGDQTAQPSGHWTTTLTTEPRPPYVSKDIPCGLTTQWIVHLHKTPLNKCQGTNCWQAVEMIYWLWLHCCIGEETSRIRGRYESDFMETAGVKRVLDGLIATKRGITCVCVQVWDTGRANKQMLVKTGGRDGGLRVGLDL